jgi:MFS family permease
MDRYGATRMLLGLSLLICIGQALVVLGSMQKNAMIMLIGRVVFGLGGESVGVAQATITTSWFR